MRPVKDDLHVVRATEVEIVGDQRFEEPAGVAGCIEDDGAGELDLPHGGLPPVAGVAVGVGERLRQQRQPALHENVDHTRPQTVTDLLQGWRVGGGGKTVGQLGETDAGVGGPGVWPTRGR